MTASELLVLIGELLAIDIEQIEDIKYPESVPEFSKLIIIFKNGKKFGLQIKELRNFEE